MVRRRRRTVTTPMRRGGPAKEMSSNAGFWTRQPSTVHGDDEEWAVRGASSTLAMNR